MTTAYTPILQLALPVTGELNGTWGDVVNNNITSMVEQAIAGLATISTWTTQSHTLTTANGTTDEARCAILQCSGAPGGAATVICPALSKVYIIQNAVTGGYAVTLKTSAGTGISVPNGSTALLYCDGTNVVSGSTYMATIVATSITDTGLTSGRVTYAGTGGLLQDAAAFTFDGTILSATRFAGALNGTVGATTPAAGAFTTLSATGITTVAAGSAALPAIVSTTGTADTGLWFPAADTVAASTAGTERLRIDSTGTISLGATPGAESLRVTPVASSVNYMQVVGAVTTGTPVLSAQGSDTNISLRYQPKGTGSSLFLGGDGTPQFLISSTATAVNFFQTYGAPTGSSPALNAIGTDTNISLTLTPKGTGAVQVTGTGFSPNFALTDAATIAWDTTTAGGQVATFTFVSSNRTMGAPTNLKNGAFYALAVIQNGGSNTLTWNSVFKWAAGTAPTLSTAAGAKDYFTFRSDGSSLFQQGISQAVA